MIEEYLEDVDKVEEVEGEINVIEGLTSYKVNQINDKFDKALNDLREQKNDIVNDIQHRNTEKKNRLIMEKNNLYEKIGEFRKKVKYLEKQKEIENTALRFNEKSITVRKDYRNLQLHKLGVFYKDDYMLIKLYIAENDKPKNKFSLIAYGITKFKKGFLDSPDSYGLPTSDSGCGCNIRESIKDLPTLEGLKEYLEKNKDRILKDFIEKYKTVRDEYLFITHNYTLKTFKDIYKIKEVPEGEAIVVCIVDRSEWRLYKNFYYSRAKKIDQKYPTDYIKINGKVYKRMCRKELMMITETGNTLFGSWWSMSLEASPYQRGGIQFTKENYEKTLDEALRYINKSNKNRRGEKVTFRYPKVKWFNDYPIRDIEDKVRIM